MNKLKILTLLSGLLAGQLTVAQVKVGDIPASANNINTSAVFEVESTTKGLLPPRMTLAQLNAITTPAAGLIVFCTDCGTGGSGRLVLQGTTGGWAALDGTTATAMPAAPAAPIATNTTNTAYGSTPTISVAFTPPASNGAPITNYRVTSTPAAAVVTGTSSPIVINTGLTLGTAYTFKVEAYNANGWSAASPASNVAIAATVPAAPTAVAATTSTTLINSASVAFTAPNNGGSAITNYTVTSAPGGITATGTSSPIVVTGLTAGTAYTFTVKATNGIGQSLASSASSAVTVYGNSIGSAAKCDSQYTLTAVVPVVSTTGKTWMDRNIGASRAATSLTDYESFGCIFQWGRGMDGHANVTYTSATTGTYASTTTTKSNNPGNALVILDPSNTGPYDWRVTPDATLWNNAQTASPCTPLSGGYRVPTIAELQAEFTALSITNRATAFSSPLKIPASHSRSGGDGAISTVNTLIWSATPSSDYSRVALIYTNGIVPTAEYARSQGAAVRCIKN